MSERKNSRAVRKRVSALMGQVMAYEWRFILATLPGYARDHRWRVVKWRTIERALLKYSEFLQAELRRNGIDPDTVTTVYRPQRNKPGAVWKKLPDKPLTPGPRGRRIRKISRSQLTATELLGLGQTGQKEFYIDD